MPLISTAQSQSSDVTDGLTHYRVEVLVFRNLDTTRDSEDPGRPPLPPEPINELAQLFEQESVEDPSADMSSDPEQSTQPAIAQGDERFQLEPEPLFFNTSEVFQLDEVAARIRRSRGYRLLLHESWRQPGFPSETAQPVDVITLEQLRRLGSAERDNTPSPVGDGDTLSQAAILTGSMTLYRSRYLHFSVDLAFQPADSDNFVIKERRRMRSGELHYLDSPGLGVIAIVVPVQDPVSTEDSTASEPTLPPA
jgi:hypothetical protein